MKTLRRLAAFALLLTLVVVVFGAYVRLSDAGLGCPDWPGCYGKVTPAHAAEHILDAQAIRPDGPVSLPKAWKEMIHRYLAASLGLLIVAIAVLCWRRRKEAGAGAGLALALVGVVVFQGLLGKWTVTLLLKPAIVTGHLLGGLTTLALLAWLTFRLRDMRRVASAGGLVAMARIGLILLVLQIALGGWVSTNYAALACTDFPTCHGQWMPADADFANAFHVVRELGMTADGELLSNQALTAIHWTHRLGALIVGAYLLLLALLMLRHRHSAPHGAALGAGVLLQVSLGIANVLTSLPLPLAVAHNAVAALLVLIMVLINYRLRRSTSPAWSAGREHESVYA